jgi:hypothetical protein
MALFGAGAQAADGLERAPASAGRCLGCTKPELYRRHGGLISNA